MSRNVPDTPTTHRLFGIGVGPGDPELVTIKAVRALRDCDAILVPATEASAYGPGRAEAIVLAACPEVAERIVRVPFSMADRTGVTQRRAEAWRASADAAVQAFADGAGQVGFATIGDPSVYSTFSYLVASVRDQLGALDVQLVPGITAMQALAAASRTPLVEGDESLTLITMKHGLDDVTHALDAHPGGTVVAYKIGRHFAALRDHLEQRGGEHVVGIDVGLPDERLGRAAYFDEAPYFGAALITPTRTSTGGRL